MPRIIVEGDFRKKRNIQCGDVLRFSSVSENPSYHVVMRERSNIGQDIRFCLLSLKDFSTYWIGDLTQEELNEYADDALEHYTVDEYDLIIRSCAK